VSDVINALAGDVVTVEQGQICVAHAGSTVTVNDGGLCRARKGANVIDHRPSRGGAK